MDTDAHLIPNGQGDEITVHNKSHTLAETNTLMCIIKIKFDFKQTIRQKLPLSSSAQSLSKSLSAASETVKLGIQEGKKKNANLK